MTTERIHQDIADALLERPLWFVLTPTQGRKGKGERRGKGIRLALYPPTLGKVLLTASILGAIDIDAQQVAHSPAREALRLAQEHRGDILRIIAIHTLQERGKILDERVLSQRIGQLSALCREELAELLIAILDHDRTAEIMHTTGISGDIELRSRIAEVKGESGGSLSVGGRTLYGSLADQAAQRYGWTLDYIVWGISYTSLKLMLADASTSIYLSEEEERQIGITTRPVIDADAPESIAQMRAVLGLDN